MEKGSVVKQNLVGEVAEGHQLHLFEEVAEEG